MAADTIDLTGEGGVTQTYDLPLSEVMVDQLARGAVTPADGSEGAAESILSTDDDTEVAPDDAPDGPPAKSASKAEWVAYAVTQGADAADADELKKDDLIEAYGQEED